MRESDSVLAPIRTVYVFLFYLYKIFNLCIVLCFDFHRAHISIQPKFYLVIFYISRGGFALLCFTEK